MPHSGTIWTGDLLYLTDLLDLSERATRATLSRMVRKGWLKADRQGRRSYYSLTARGRSLLEQGKQRIFERPFTDWDGRWHLVIYSIPEKKRKLRRALRRQLTWLGFGHLAPATWISPHDRKAELNNVLDELSLHAYVDLFSSRYLGPSSTKELVQRCWDLPELEDEYQQFVTCYRPQYEACQAKSEAELRASLEDCFVRHFQVAHAFQPFPRKDPHLPTELLPPDWIGFTALELFDNYRRLLEPYVTDFIDEILEVDQ
jgi:phenylacetic acid degradation operon negative regulatory protein